MTEISDPKARIALLEDVLWRAKACGATAADVVLADSASLSVTRRMGKQESLMRSEEFEIGLRVLVGRRQAIVSSADPAQDVLMAMAERAVAMARAVPEDAYAGIADAADLAKEWPDLELNDPTEVSVGKMNEMADAAESAALSVKGVTNSDGAEFSFGKDHFYYLATNGFCASYASSGFSLSVSVIAGKDAAMETDYDFDSATFFSDLKDPAAIGASAGQRAARALNPQKGPTRQVPVVFENRIAGGIIGSLASAASGSAVARGTTILKDRMGQQVCAPCVTVVDDPFLKRGARSHPFDAEGLAPCKRNIVEGGVLTGWLLDLSSARQLGLRPTGNASRGAGSPPSPRPANFYMLGGEKTPEELIAGIEDGFYVTELMGSGANILTGDYSRGARGFWIKGGKITHPVSEMTIAGNIKDMWMHLSPANDLDLRYGIDAPTLCIDGMTVAGV